MLEHDATHHVLRLYVDAPPEEEPDPEWEVCLHFVLFSPPFHFITLVTSSHFITFLAHHYFITSSHFITYFIHFITFHPIYFAPLLHHFIHFITFYFAPLHHISSTSSYYISSLHPISSLHSISPLHSITSLHPISSTSVANNVTASLFSFHLSLKHYSHLLPSLELRWAIAALKSRPRLKPNMH